MPRHGKPDSRVLNLLHSFGKSIAVGLIFSVVAGVSGTWIYNHYFGAKQAVINAHKISQDKKEAELHDVAARVSVDQAPRSWASWISNDEIEIAPGEIRGIGENGFPSDGLAINADTPFAHDFQESQVASRFSFTLTGNRSTLARITKICAVIDSRQPPPHGTVYYAIPQGATSKEDFAIDFGSGDLNAREQNDDGVPTATHYLDGKTVTLAKDESIGFNVVAVAPIYDVDITYHLEIAFDDNSVVRVKGGDENPFRIVSYPRHATRGYVTAKDGPASDAHNYGVFPCSWPEQCRDNVFHDWPFEP